MFSKSPLNVDFSTKTCYCLVNIVNAFSGFYGFARFVIAKPLYPGPPPATISRCCRGRRPRRPAEGSRPLPTCPSYVGAGHARPASFPQTHPCRTQPGRTCAAPTTLPADLSVCAPVQTPPHFFIYYLLFIKGVPHAHHQRRCRCCGRIPHHRFPSHERPGRAAPHPRRYHCPHPERNARAGLSAQPERPPSAQQRRAQAGHRVFLAAGLPRQYAGALPFFNTDRPAREKL